MNASPDKYIDRLVEILQKKQTLLQDLLALTEKQADSIHEEGIENLEGIIDRKQERIDAINKLDEEFHVYFQRMKSTLGIRSLEELDASRVPGARQLKVITEQIMALITRIGALEKQNSARAKELLDQLGGEIKKLNQGKRVNNVYTPGPMANPSYFIDKKK